MSQYANHSRLSRAVDVLCIGAAVFDLVFTVDRHPSPDEKAVATGLISCGGGPAANAAVTVARLGGRSALAAYLGRDAPGDTHLAELAAAGVLTDLICRGDLPTSTSAVLVKPDGRRTVINHRGHPPISTEAVSFDGWRPKAILLDGHEPALSLSAARFGREADIPVTLDAGSVNEGTTLLVNHVDYLVSAEAFALGFTGQTDPGRAAAQLAQKVPNVIITLGERGLVWQRGSQSGSVPAFPVAAVDTTGAGDVFHGAFVLGLARRMAWPELLRYASAAAAVSCARLGARPGIPSAPEVDAFLAANADPG